MNNQSNNDFFSTFYNNTSNSNINPITENKENYNQQFSQNNYGDYYNCQNQNTINNNNLNNNNYNYNNNYNNIGNTNNNVNSNMTSNIGNDAFYNNFYGTQGVNQGNINVQDYVNPDYERNFHSTESNEYTFNTPKKAKSKRYSSRSHSNNILVNLIAVSLFVLLLYIVVGIPDTKKDNVATTPTNTTVSKDSKVKANKSIEVDIYNLKYK